MKQLTKSVFALLLAFALASNIAIAQTTVNTLLELLPYLDDDNADVKMAPGTYTITASHVKNGYFGSTTFQESARVILLFKGNNSTYDFTGVTINFETAIFKALGSNQVYEVNITGSNNVLKNLTMVDLGSVHDNPTKGALGICMDGRDNRIEGFHQTVKGSYPYGYGDCFGKGGTNNIISHKKHSAFLIRGLRNHALNCTIIHRSYGHAMFMQAASYPKIEGCYIEGEMRSTDDMLAEKGTGTPADKVNFMTTWGYPIPPGYMMSTGEAGIRAYNAGSTIVDGVEFSRATSNPTILNCTIKHLRTGVTVAHASGTKYVEGCTAIGCENGFSLGSGNVVNCKADCAYGPVYASTYESDKNYNADITLIPAEDPYYNGSGNIAYIGGSGHKITFRGSSEPFDNGLKISVGGDKNNIRLLYGNLPHQNDFAASNFELNNLTHNPVFLSDKSSGVTGQSGGMVTDLGSNNKVKLIPVSVSKIEAEDYAAMSGISTETCADLDEGENVTGIVTGDWMEYTIDIPFAGNYSLDYRVASAASGSFDLVNNGEIIDQVSFPATGGTDYWYTFKSAAPFFLEAGENTLKISANSDGWDINWMDLSLVCAETPIVPFYEILNPLGVSFGLQQATEVVSFPGNTLSIQPEPIMGGTWSWTGPNNFTANTRTIKIEDIQEINSGAYEVTFTNDCGVQDTKVFNVEVSDTYTIEAEDYTTMNGVSTETTSDEAAGENVTSIDAGDWMEYTVDVLVSATFNFDFRVASEAAEGDFTLSVDGKDLDQVTFSATGGAQTWTTAKTNSVVYLSAGSHTIRVSAISAGWNLNWLKLDGQDFVSACNLPLSDDGFTTQNSAVSWTTGLMDISCVTSVNVYAVLSEIGNLSDTDYLNIYYKLDDGESIAISENKGSLNKTTAIVKELQGNTLELIVESSTGRTNDYYVVSKIIVAETSNQLARIEAEDYDRGNGTKIGGTSDVGGGNRLGSITPGNWTMYANLDLTGLNSIDMRLASIYSDAYVEVRLGSEDGTLIGKVDVPKTGSWNTYKTASAGIRATTGFYDVYLVYKTVTSANPCNINWLQFSETKLDNTIDFFTKIEAEDFTEMLGIQTETTTDTDGGSNVGWINDGDWLMFSDVDLTGVGGIDTRLASKVSTSTIEIRLGSATGSLVGTVIIPKTGGNQTWSTVNTVLSKISGVHDVYLVFKGATGYLANINWLQFTTATGVKSVSGENTFTIFPNPVNDQLTINSKTLSSVEIYNSLGQLVYNESIQSTKHSVNISNYFNGLYVVRLISNGQATSQTILKQ